jgi:rhomboid protease GluP
MNPENPETAWAPPEERPLLITPDMLVPVRPKDSRVPFEKGMSYFPVLIVTLIIANFAVFLWELATGALVSSDSIIAAGALYRDKVLAGETWRLVSAAFLHGDFEHILGNTVFMYILGLATEHAFGLAKTAVIYLFAAVTGSLLSLAMQPGPGVGASGAIFGLMGAVAVVFYRRRADFYLRDRGIGAFVGFLAALQIFFGFSEPYVDNWAHLGGFLGGALAVLVLRPALGEETRAFSPAAKGLTVAAVTLAAAVLLYSGGFLAGAEAQAWLHFGNKPAALDAATRALGKNPANTHMYLVRGLLYLDAKQYDAAAADFARYLDANQNSPLAFSAIGHAYYERERFPEAIGYYSSALALAPRDVNLLNSRGYASILAGDLPAARADFAAILKIKADYAPAWGNLGLVLAHEGNYPKAIEHLEKARSLDKSQDVLQYLIRALGAELRAQRAEAVAGYTSFITITRDDRLAWLAEIRFAETRLAALKRLGK